MSLRHSIRFDIVVVHHRLETEKRIKKTTEEKRGENTQDYAIDQSKKKRCTKGEKKTKIDQSSVTGTVGCIEEDDADE